MKVRFGPAGLGPVKDAVKNLEYYHNLGLGACEIAFTYGIYIKKESDMAEIKNAALKYDIKLSIHAPYWINLNSKDQIKIRESKQRILYCCEVGEKLGAYRVVFHPGFYGKLGKDETYENIKNAIIDIQEQVKKNNWKIKIAAETMGKVNVFGSFSQISQLVKDTDCSFCIDFAHILAREKIIDYEGIKNLFLKYDQWHCHFSGIVYGEKGEKHHIKTPRENWKEVIKNLPKNNEIVIINESPDPVADSIEGKRIYENFAKFSG